jgi:hypothetical protein
MEDRWDKTAGGPRRQEAPVGGPPGGSRSARPQAIKSKGGARGDHQSESLCTGAGASGAKQVEEGGTNR